MIKLFRCASLAAKYDFESTKYKGTFDSKPCFGALWSALRKLDTDILTDFSFTVYQRYPIKSNCSDLINSDYLHNNYCVLTPEELTEWHNIICQMFDSSVKNIPINLKITFKQIKRNFCSATNVPVYKIKATADIMTKMQFFVLCTLLRCSSEHPTATGLKESFLIARDNIFPQYSILEIFSLMYNIMGQPYDQGLLSTEWKRSDQWVKPLSIKEAKERLTCTPRSLKIYGDYVQLFLPIVKINIPYLFKNTFSADIIDIPIVGKISDKEHEILRTLIRSTIPYIGEVSPTICSYLNDNINTALDIWTGTKASNYNIQILEYIIKCWEQNNKK